MTPEQKQRFADQLQKNPLLPSMLDERIADIKGTWEGEDDAAKREQLWHELKATNDLKDFIYATISELAG